MRLHVTRVQAAQTESDKPKVTTLTKSKMNDRDIGCSYLFEPKGNCKCMDFKDYEKSLMDQNLAEIRNAYPTEHNPNSIDQPPSSIQAGIQVLNEFPEETRNFHFATTRPMLPNPSPMSIQCEEHREITEAQPQELHRYAEFDEWPDGNVSYIYKPNDKRAAQHKTGWAMRNTNNHNKMVLKKSCLGIFVCSKFCKPLGMTTIYRPAVCGIAREKQLSLECPTPGCGGTLIHVKCTGNNGHPVTHFWQKYEDHIHFRAKGYHNHARPGKKIYAGNTKSKKVVKSTVVLPSQEHQAFLHRLHSERLLKNDSIIAITEESQVFTQPMIESTGNEEKWKEIGASPISTRRSIPSLFSGAGEDVVNHQMSPQSLHYSSPSQPWRKYDDLGQQQSGEILAAVECSHDHHQELNAIAPMGCYWNKTQSAYPFTSWCAENSCYYQDGQKYQGFINLPEKRNECVVANCTTVHAMPSSAIFNENCGFRGPCSCNTSDSRVKSLNHLEANTQCVTVRNHRPQHQEYKGLTNMRWKVM
ncbi:hypothetical protein Aperf_G00000004725 [Anoplocephala perfoliata]